MQFLCVASPDYSKHSWFTSPLEFAICQKFLSIHGFPSPSDIWSESYLAFPYPLVASGFLILTPHREKYKFSCELSHPLLDLILWQCDSLPHDVIDSQCFILKQLSQAKLQSQVDAAQSVLAHSLASLHQSLECCKEKGASSWLSANPIEQHGFTLHKTSFTDALCLHYGWSPSHLPFHCVCSKALSQCLIL